MKNIAYKTDQLARYFESNRASWAQFYPSERWILERVATQQGPMRVLDVGCAAGGLGLALEERFPLAFYAGVEINEQAVRIARGRRFRCHAEFHLGDVLKMGEIPGDPFDLVANLSCADWNIETNAIIDACWRRTAPGGRFVISLRLSERPSINDFSRSFQHICYDGVDPEQQERANYVIFNVNDALRLFERLRPAASHVLGYGYWGPPSKTAVTPYERLVFAVFAVKKSELLDNQPGGEIVSELHMPLSLWSAGKD